MLKLLINPSCNTKWYSELLKHYFQKELQNSTSSFKISFLRLFISNQLNLTFVSRKQLCERNPFIIWNNLVSYLNYADVPFRTAVAVRSQAFAGYSTIIFLLLGHINVCQKTEGGRVADSLLWSNEKWICVNHLVKFCNLWNKEKFMFRIVILHFHKLLSVFLQGNLAP